MNQYSGRQARSSLKPQASSLKPQASSLKPQASSLKPISLKWLWVACQIRSFQFLSIIIATFMLQIGFVENALSEDLATESTLSRFHYYDVLVEGNVTYALTSTPIANAQVFTNPDGTKFPVQEIWLLKIDNSTRKIISAPKIGDYAASHGVLSISGDSIRAAFNYKARSGDYAMSGKYHSWSKTEFYSSTAQSLFENANCGWYPKFLTTGLTVEHFCYSGYYRVQGVTIIGQVQPAVMAQEYNDLLKSHSQGIVPKTTDAEVVQALLKSFPAVECPKNFTQTELDKAVNDAKSAADTAGYNRGYKEGLAAAPKGFAQADLDNARSVGYQAGLAAAPKGITQAELETAKSAADTAGYNRGYSKGVADTTAKPPANPTPVAPVITSVTPSSLKEGQAIEGDPTTWFKLTVKGSNFSNPAVFIPGIKHTLVSSSSTATEIVLNVEEVYRSSTDPQVPQGDRPVTVKNKDASNNVINEATKSGILTVTDRPVLPVVSPLATLPPPMFKFCASATIEDKPATHEGVDYKASLGDSVHSICDGTVKLNNTDELYGATHYDTQYGKYWNSFLIIKHNCNGDTVYGSYGHLKSSLSVGATVKAGDIIGSIRESYGKGDVRTVNNDHLHFGLSRKDPGTRGWGYSDGNLSCDAVKTNGWLDPETYLAFQQNATPTTKNNPKLMSPIDNTQNMSTNGVNLSWDLNNTATVSDVKLTLREAAGYNGTAGNYVGTCNAKSIGKVTSYSSNSCGALKPNQWYKWFVGLYFTDGLENNKGAEGYFMTAPTTTPALTLTALASNCSTTTLNSGGNATCKVIATYSDNSTKDVTTSSTWTSSDSSVLSVNQGNLTAGSPTTNVNVTVTASYTEKGITKKSSVALVVKKLTDTESPTGKLTSSIRSTYTKGEKIAVSWKVTDNMQLFKVSFNVTSASDTSTVITSVSKSITTGWTDNGKTGIGSYEIDTSKLLGTYYYALWVRDAAGLSQELQTGSFTVTAPPPQVTGVSPLTATYGKSTTFTVTGTNLPDTLAFYIKDCPSPTVVGSRSATTQKFSCTPSYTKGVKDGKVNDKTGGSTLKPFNVTVK